MERVCWSPSKIIGEHGPLPPTPSLPTRTSYNLCSMLSSLPPEDLRESVSFLPKLPLSVVRQPKMLFRTPINFNFDFYVSKIMHL